MKAPQEKVINKTSDVTDISAAWDKDNQAWWDWYVTLAENKTKTDALLATEPLPNIEIPTNDEVISELTEPYPLKKDQIAFFRKNGFIKIKNIFSPQELY